MKKVEEKIIQLQSQILESRIETEKELLLTEMKKIGIEKLPYSYSALKPFIDSETMDFHYNKHYKGYVDKLNDALSKKKYGDLELEQIIKNISRYDKSIRNNAGGAFNHALFWNMLSPKTQKLTGELYKKITKKWGTFTNFKKEFETAAKDRFGSGWVWLVLTAKNQLKIMTTPNQDNPLMNIIDGGGFPLLGLDLWEHAYYLKYRNKRDDYILNFWKVVNWDFVTKMYELRTQTKLLESTEFRNVISEQKTANFCDAKEIVYYKELLNPYKNKKFYEEEVRKTLKSVFGQFWVEETKDEMSGFYGIESPEGRSILNNLNSNINTFCLLVKAVNKEIDKIGKSDKKFDFTKKEKSNMKELSRFLNALDYFKTNIYTKKNPDFVNIVNVLLILWERGQKSERKVEEKLQNYFGESAKVTRFGKHGSKKDAFGGVDIVINLDGVDYTGQIKPFNTTKTEGDDIAVLGNANYADYTTDWLLFHNTKTDQILIFENKPIGRKYVFKLNSLLHEIE